MTNVSQVPSRQDVFSGVQCSRLELSNGLMQRYIGQRVRTGHRASPFSPTNTALPNLHVLTNPKATRTCPFGFNGRFRIWAQLIKSLPIGNWFSLKPLPLPNQGQWRWDRLKVPTLSSDGWFSGKPAPSLGDSKSHFINMTRDTFIAPVT